MNVFTYVVEHDFGFAPNPFNGICTLACCKPDIRRAAELGDYVLGTGAAKPGLQDHLIYWMKVDEILSFQDYWHDPRFRKKKPIMTGSTYLRFGDNIYFRGQDGAYQQVDSFHSRADGTVSAGNLRVDTGKTDSVLLARQFAFWGRAAIALPDHLKCFVKKGPGFKRYFADADKDRLVAWLETHSERGYRDEPSHWQYIEH